MPIITATLRLHPDSPTYELPAEFKPFFRSASVPPEDFGSFFALANLAAEKTGYTLTAQSHRLEFCCKQTTKLNLAAIMQETKYISLPTWHLERKMWEEDHYYYSGAGIVRDHRLLSWCVENSHRLPDDETEIGVWTDPDFQKMGFATSNVVYLCSQLQKRGLKRILYSADVDNEASLRVAHKAGLDEESEAWQLVYTK